MKQRALRPGDVVVLIALAITDQRGLVGVASASGRSVGEAHGAIRRLRSAGLVDDDTNLPAVEVVVPFLEWGVPFAYPAEILSPALGMPTAILDPNDPAAADLAGYVWPSARGSVVRDAIIPLHPRVPEVALESPQLRTALSLIDMLRVGATEDRRVAIAKLRELLTRERDVTR